MKTYQPLILRPIDTLKGVVYCVATKLKQNKKVTYTTWKGPYCFEQQALEIVGKTTKHFILQIDSSSYVKELWKWKTDRWIKLD